jgi:hypothetical protein
MKTLLRLIPALVLVAPLPASDVAPAGSPADIVRRAAQHEVLANGQSHHPFMFKDEKKTRRLAETKLLVETCEATAGLLLAENGHPLSPAERQAEEARLENYVRNPQELARKRKQEREDAERTERILRALPDAFLFQPDGMQPASSSLGHPGDDLIRFKFQPNPNYVPPSRVEQVLTAMQGSVLIDEKQNRIARIDGMLEKEVGFGWGVLGHLDRGGRFLVDQADVGDGQWEVTRMELAFTGRILLVKKINIQSSDTFSDFRPLPSELSFAQGVELLKKEAKNVISRSLSQPSGAERAAKQGKQAGVEQAERDLCCDR